MAPNSEHPFWSYRLAKLEVHAERRGAGRLPFAKYEADLADRLAAISNDAIESSRLFREINPGNILLHPKEHTPEPSPDDSFIIVSNGINRSATGTLRARVVLEPTPDFTIHEVIWLRRFGAALENLLGPACKANRLQLLSEDGEIPATGRRVFRHWAPAYRKFRRSPLSTARDLLTNNRNCTLMLLDIASYYDNIDPGFLCSDRFVGQVHRATEWLDIPFDPNEYLAATQGLLGSFARYRSEVEHALGVSLVRGIPIGSLTARLIGNLALAELDRHFVQPNDDSIRHYSRYVDDIAIVIESPGVDQERFTATSVRQILPLDEQRTTAGRFVLDEERLGRPGSRFSIQHEKLKVFVLDGEAGLEYLAAVELELNQLSSGRRRFLDLTDSELNQTMALSSKGEPIRVLREADALSLSRLAAGVVCNKIITSAKMLDRAEASSLSREQLGRSGRLAVRGTRWVEYLDISLRILAAALISGDSDTANEVIDGIMCHLKEMSFTAIEWGAHSLDVDKAMRLLRHSVETQVLETISSASPFSVDGFTIRGVRALDEGLHLQSGLLLPDEILKYAQSLARADLRLVDRESEIATESTPLTQSEQTVESIAIALGQRSEHADQLRQIQQFLDICDEQGDSVYAGRSVMDVLLATRPPTYTDILFLWIRAGRPLSQLLEVVNAVRGTRYFTNSMSEDDGFVIADGVSGDSFSGTTRIVLGNLCTEVEWCSAALRSMPVLTRERQARVARVINQAIEVAKAGRDPSKVTPTLLVLPELSLPRRWQREVFSHLVSHGAGLGLVGGIEYDVKGRDVYNEAVAFLPRSYSTSAGWVWTKGQPAHQEGRDLREAGFVFKGRDPNLRFIVMSSEHGRFAPLICSEFLEIGARAELTGRVEMLLIPAWNKDRNTFEKMAQAASLDMHSFVAIANNGEISDCRVCGPFKEEYRRDVCRLISPGANETVVADLPIQSLRQYQQNEVQYEHDVRAGKLVAPEWKPMPPGVAQEVANTRRITDMYRLDGSLGEIGGESEESA